MSGKWLSILRFALLIAVAVSTSQTALALCDQTGSFTRDAMYPFIETRACCESTNEGQLHWWTIQMRNRSSKTVTVHWKVLTPAYGGDTNNCCESRLGPGETTDFTFRTRSVSCTGGQRVWHQLLSVKEED